MGGFLEKVEKTENWELIQLRKLRPFKIEIIKSLMIIYDKFEGIREVKPSTQKRKQRGGCAAPFVFGMGGLIQLLESLRFFHK